MDPTRWRQVEQIVADAIEQPEPDWEAFTAARAGDDATVLREVRALLAAHRDSGEFLERPAITFTGGRFGPWRALGEIGRGGMSVVYLGERADQAFEKQVAIKVIAGVPASFPEGERQILAGLEHPNIARLLDAGATDDGFPYLVVEYVEGQRLDQFARNLDQAGKIRLLQQVCAGVQYAHRHLVVHRDLKPANIFVTADGTVKLLDFGIAKIVTPGEGGHTTRFSAWTVDYASPEQILGRGVTTGGDIYSLGVLLHELLTGERPRRLEGKNMEELVSAAREEIGPLRLTGDLEQIARKALRVDPAQRYESVAAFADDLQRYLDRRPIAAHAPSLTYRLGKFVARNRVAVGLAALAVTAGGIAIGAIVFQARIAERRFQQVRGLARTITFELNDALQPLSGSTPVRKMVVERALAYLDALSKEAGNDRDLLLELGQGYARLGVVQGSINEPNLGHVTAALASFEKARAIFERLVAAKPGDAAARFELAKVLGSLGQQHLNRGDMVKALEMARRERELIESLPDAAEVDRAAALFRLAVVLQNTKGRLEEAVPLWDRLAEIYERRLAAAPTSDPELRSVALVNRYRTDLEGYRKNLPAAERYLRRAIEVDEQRLAARPTDPLVLTDVSFDYAQLGYLANQQKRSAEAVEHYRRSLGLREKLLANDPANARLRIMVARNHANLGYSLHLANRRADGAAAFRRAVAMIRALPDRTPTVQNIFPLAYPLAMLGSYAEVEGRSAEACAQFAEALAEANKLDSYVWDPEIQATFEAARAALARCPKR